jgi:hypothetical protein
MPWDIRKRDSEYLVVSQTTGEVVGKHKSRDKAERQLRALYANYRPAATPGAMAHGGRMMLDDTYTPRPITDVFVDGRRVPVRQLKKGGKVMEKKPPLGTGERFAQLKAKLAGRKGVTDPAALAAYIGRKKYGKKRFQELAAKGRKRKTG